MKVLFLASGLMGGNFGVVVQNQYDSLSSANIELSQYIVNSGLKGYLKAILELRQFCKKNSVSLIHAHYTLCGFVASLSIPGLPVVCSLMGSDLTHPVTAKLARVFAKYFWTHTIVKSDAMLRVIGHVKSASVIPNGVDIDLFKPVDEFFFDFRFDRSMKNVLFIGNVYRPEKNHALAKQACELISDRGFVLRTISNTDRREIPSIIRSADVLLMTSFREGSPNVVKEAMASNIPVVATRVGDVEYLFDGAHGYYIADYDPQDIADKLVRAVENRSDCDGRQVILQKGLDSRSIAYKISELYKSAVDYA